MAYITDHGLSATQAMDLSSQEDRTVRLDWSEVLESDLAVDCADSSEVEEDGVTVLEYWGGDEPGARDEGEPVREWRVALVRRSSCRVSP